MPMSRYVDESELGLHGELQYGIHRFCDVWPVLTFRRVDVHVRRIDLRSSSWVLPECCR